MASRKFISILCWLFLSTCAVTNAQWTPQTEIESRNLDQIYEEARLEAGDLKIFAGGDAGDQMDIVIDAWNDRFPDINLDLRIDLSKYLDVEIDRQWYENNVTTDIAMLQTLHDFPRWKEQNRLLYYKPSLWEYLYISEKDADGAFLPALQFSFGQIKFDTSKIDASDVPDNFAAFTDAKWKGRLALAWPNDDDAVNYLFAKLVSYYGMEWLEALKANDVKWVRGTHTPVDLIEKAHNDTSNPLAITFTTIEGTGSWWGTASATTPRHAAMSWSQTAAIFSSTSRPNKAKLFLSWIVGDEFQNLLASAGASSPRASIDNYKIYQETTTEITGYRLFMQNQALVGRWKQVFENTLGTAQGPGPLLLYPQ